MTHGPTVTGHLAFDHGVQALSDSDGGVVPEFDPKHWVPAGLRCEHQQPRAASDHYSGHHHVPARPCWVVHNVSGREGKCTRLTRFVTKARNDRGTNHEEHGQQKKALYDVAHGRHRLVA